MRRFVADCWRTTEIRVRYSEWCPYTVYVDGTANRGKTGENVEIRLL